MKKGTFYGISVGPGDPELLTLKAVRLLNACPVIAAPQTAGGKTLALDIVRGAVDVSAKTLLLLPMAMSRDEDATLAAHREAADRICAELAAGRDVAMPNLGDVSIYATFSYLQKLVAAGGWPTAMVAGVPSFCAVAAALNAPLTERDEPLHLIPGGAADPEQMLALPGTKVWMKAGRELPHVVECLRAGGHRAALVQSCGLPNEKVFADVADYTGDTDYFAIVVVKD